MTTFKNRVRLAQLMIAGLLVSTIVLTSASSSNGHIFASNGFWYFSRTTNELKGNELKAKDPINLIFKGGAYLYGPAPVKQHLKDDFPGMGVAAGGSQRLEWRSGLLYGPRFNWEPQDFQVATKWCCKKRTHIRGWDESAHATLTNTQNTWDWVVASIHHENDSHNIDVDWDVMRRRAIGQMAEHCSWARWQKYPGKPSKYGGWESSGWITRISLRHTSQGCAGG